MFVATRLLQPELRRSAEAEPQRRARAGMWWMTSLGLVCGLVGALLEDVLGDSALVAAPYALYRLCWAPAFWMSALQEELADRGLNAPLLGSLGLMLIPVFWFLVFLCVGQLRARRRAR
jgi:hypothetical protein